MSSDPSTPAGEVCISAPDGGNTFFLFFWPHALELQSVGLRRISVQTVHLRCKHNLVILFQSLHGNQHVFARSFSKGGFTRMFARVSSVCVFLRSQCAELSVPPCENSIYNTYYHLTSQLSLGRAPTVLRFIKPYG